MLLLRKRKSRKLVLIVFYSDSGYHVQCITLLFVGNKLARQASAVVPQQHVAEYTNASVFRLLLESMTHELSLLLT